MPRGVSKKREMMALFLNMSSVPPEMQPKGKRAVGKSVKVVVLDQTAKTIRLQYTEPKGRKNQVLQVTAEFPIESVVLYEVHAVDAEVEPAAPKATKKGKKKAAPKKKAGKVAVDKMVIRAIRENEGPMGMGDLTKVTEQEAPQLRAAIAALIEEGRVEKEGAGRGTTYGLVRKKRKTAKKKPGSKKRRAKKTAKKKVGRKKRKKTTEEEPSKKKKRKKRKGSAAPEKKTRKKKKGKKKKTRKFSSSRRKTSFRLDDED